MIDNKLHIVHEVVDTSSKADALSEAQSSNSRYRYLAEATLLGYPNLRPYDPIYLDGLPDDMSGTWVVLSVVHVFNEIMAYQMEVTLGSNDYLLSILPTKADKDILSNRQVRDMITSSDSESLVLPVVNFTKRDDFYLDHHQGVDIDPEEAFPSPLVPNQLTSWASVNLNTNVVSTDRLFNSHTPNVNANKQESIWRLVQ